MSVVKKKTRGISGLAYYAANPSRYIDTSGAARNARAIQYGEVSHSRFGRIGVEVVLAISLLAGGICYLFWW